MTALWAIDSQKGFFWEIPLATAAVKDFDQISDIFASTPDTNYYAILPCTTAAWGATPTRSPWPI